MAKLYICPMDRTDKLVNILIDKDILDICNELEDGDALDIYVTHVVPLNVVDINEASKWKKKIVNLPPALAPAHALAPPPSPSREQESDVDSESDDYDEGEDDNENDSDFDNHDSDESDGVDLHVPDDNDYGSDVHEEFVECRDELRKYRRKKSERPKDKGDNNLGETGVDIDAEDEFDEEHNETMAAKRRKKALIFDQTKGVQLEKYINEPGRVRVKCMHPKCPWLLAASKDGISNNFKVKKYLAKHYRDKIMSQPNMKVWELKKLIKDELDMYVGRSTFHRARAKILKEIICDVHVEFKRLYDYRDIMLQTNPGITCVVEGWSEGCRRIIGLDGCFLKGICKGQLLVAVSKGGNNQMFPIAWAIVEYGLLKVVSEVLPESEHRWCARHILANWSKDWRGLERRNNFWRCARASCVAELNFHLDNMNMLRNGICESLLRYNKETWCKAYFNYDRKCEIIDSNIRETFNAWILAARHKTVITMLEEIRVKIMERIGKLREFADTWICDISPNYYESVPG
ncbi:uncharacterized protein [Nicotiana tomentosiformis]|uniref:uncharacterized protein n=1 Tax=Nicotiana tomentosiformis TaxID=4098 RepID=UPI00388CB531